MLILRIWQQQAGKYFCIATKDIRGKWVDHFFSRNEFKLIGKFLKKNKDKDLYFCPHGFDRKRRLKKYAVAPKLLYADLDEVNPGTLKIKPTILIESSPGRFVGLWVIDRLMTEEINRQLTYLLDSDKGGWDLTQLLRIPQTLNYKYKSTPKVRIVWMDGPDYKLDDIIKQLPNVPLEETANDNVEAIYRRHEKHLTIFLRRELLTKKKVKPGKRSDVFWRLVQELVECGVSKDEVYELLKASPWNKFAGRNDQERQIKREIDKAIKGHIPQVKNEEPITPDEEEYTYLSRSMAQVEAEVIEWLWHPYIAKGELTILEGDPGLGKSYLAQIIGLHICDGKRLPSQKAQRVSQGKVAYFDMENSAGSVTKNRLIDNGMRNFNRFYQEEEGFSIRNDEIVDEIFEAIEKLRPVLVVFDTINSYMGKTDTHNASDTQQAFSRFREIARRFNCAVLVLRHLTKSPKERAIYRGQGSIAFTGLARVVMTVGRDPDDEKARIIAVAKNNVTSDPEALRYRIIGKPPTPKRRDRSEFIFEDFCQLTADEILSVAPAQKTFGDQSQQAVDFIYHILDEGPVDALNIRKAAEARSISPRTLYRVATEIGVIKTTKGFGKKKRTIWALPASKIKEEEGE
jgi:DNA replication protein DnaC